MPSPLQYNYRTKITPHFDAPPENRVVRGGRPRQKKERDSAWELAIGFEAKGRGQILDIEVRAILSMRILQTSRRNVLLQRVRSTAR